jgi:hypothetical protein
MKLTLTAVALLCAVPLAGHAQTAPAPAATPDAAATPAAKFNLDTPIETIAADPAGKAVLDADLPGLLTHEAYDMFKSMTLRQLQPMSQGAISEETLKKAETDLAAVK